MTGADAYALCTHLGDPYEVVINAHSTDALTVEQIIGVRVQIYLQLSGPQLRGKEAFMKNCYSTGKPIGQNLNWCASHSLRRQAGRCHAS